jgi:hypothetical protein
MKRIHGTGRKTDSFDIISELVNPVSQFFILFRILKNLLDGVEDQGV